MKISSFYGISILMFEGYFPGVPHFHARYGQSYVIVAIGSLEVLQGRGNFPSRALAFTCEWAAAKHDALMADWSLLEQNQNPKRIAGLR